MAVSGSRAAARRRAAPAWIAARRLYAECARARHARSLVRARRGKGGAPRDDAVRGALEVGHRVARQLVHNLRRVGLARLLGDDAANLRVDIFRYLCRRVAAAGREGWGNEGRAAPRPRPRPAPIPRRRTAARAGRRARCCPRAARRRGRTSARGKSRPCGARARRRPRTCARRARPRCGPPPPRRRAARRAPRRAPRAAPLRARRRPRTRARARTAPPRAPRATSCRSPACP